MLSRCLGTVAIGVLGAVVASAAAIQIGGASGLTQNYITQGAGATCAAGAGNCVAGSTGGWAEKNYNNVLFAGATNGTAPVPFSGYTQTGGEASGLTATSIGGTSSAAGVTFAMLADGASGTGASKNFWEASSANSSVVVPIGVYDVIDAATMLQNAWGTVGGNDVSITFNFGNTSNATTGLTALTFNLLDVNNQSGGNLSGVVRSAVGCSTTTTASCSAATDPYFTPNKLNTMVASDSNTYSVNTSNIFGTASTFGGVYNYTSGAVGVYANTAGALKLDDQDFVFGNTFSNKWLVSVVVTQNSTFGNNISAGALSAITVNTGGLSPVPEPGTIMLVLAGFAGLGVARRYRRT